MDIPEKMIEAQAQQMVEEFAQNIAMQGISFDQYGSLRNQCNSY